MLLKIVEIHVSLGCRNIFDFHRTNYSCCGALLLLGGVAADVGGVGEIQVQLKQLQIFLISPISGKSFQVKGKRKFVFGWVQSVLQFS